MAADDVRGLSDEMLEARRLDAFGLLVRAERAWTEFMTTASTQDLMPSTENLFSAIWSAHNAWLDATREQCRRVLGGEPDPAKPIESLTWDELNRSLLRSRVALSVATWLDAAESGREAPEGASMVATLILELDALDREVERRAGANPTGP